MVAFSDQVMFITRFYFFKTFLKIYILSKSTMDLYFNLCNSHLRKPLFKLGRLTFFYSKKKMSMYISGEICY